MTKSYTGGCACGAIRYEVAAEPIMTNDCHCRQCQRDSGTGHGSYLAFPRKAATLHGEARSFDFTGDQGVVKSRAFCQTCGTPVYMLFPGMPDIFVVRAGTLDEPKRYRPQMVFWTETAQDWDRIDPALPAFARMPPAAG
ncbi:GFA family protein [Mesorhizobium sp. KR2-14]|uniref:GFA family protein n=1 Tax=Mesorhizobium sp. KR2-14 TaxID=3156610 RepID=UPI0032B46A8E